MRKFLLILLLSLAIFSCATEEAIEPQREITMPVFEDVVAEVQEKEEDKAENLAVPGVAEESAKAEEETVIEEPPVPEEEAAPAVEEKAEEVTPRVIVDELSEKIESEYIQPDEKREAEPQVEETVKEMEEAPGEAEVIQAPQVNGEGLLDMQMNDRTFLILIELVVIVFIFTLSSVIRNKFGKPLPLSISIVLTLLFTAIPVLITLIVAGEDILLSLYSSLLLSMLVFRSKNRRI